MHSSFFYTVGGLVGYGGRQAKKYGIKEGCIQKKLQCKGRGSLKIITFKVAPYSFLTAHELISYNSQ